MIFPSCQVWIWLLDHKKLWAMKNWCFWTVMMDKSLESHLDCRETQAVNAKENWYWIFIGRADAEPEAPILWLTDVKNRLIRKYPVAGKVWRQEEKRTTWLRCHLGWDGWMASATWWTWLWASFRSWWRTVSPGMLQSMWSQRVRHNWATELNWTYPIANTICNWMFLQQDCGSPRPQDISPVKSTPMHRSQCLAFTRHSVSSDCRGTSILVDMEKQLTHLSSCLKQLQSRHDKWKSSFLHQTSGSREWIPEVESKKREFYKCSGLVHWVEEGWGGEGGGCGVQDGEHL